MIGQRETARANAATSSRGTSGRDGASQPGPADAEPVRGIQGHSGRRARTGAIARHRQPLVGAADRIRHPHQDVSPAWPQPEARGTQGKAGSAMSAEDKAKNTAEKAKGKAKEGVGQATGNESMEAEGRADQAKGDLKQAGEKVKDAFKK